MRIGRNFAEQEPCEKPRLDLDQAAHRDLIAEERMRRLLIEPPFVSGDQASPRLGPQIAAAGGKDEILGSELAIIERHENGGIGKNGPERLDEIERQGGPPRPLDMVEPLPGIEPGNGNCRREGAGQKGVAEREASIDGIGGRAPVAGFKRKGREGGNFVGEKMRKGAEIKRRRLALKAKKRSGIFRPRRALDEKIEAIEQRPARSVRPAPIAAQNRALVFNLSADKVARKGKRACLVLCRRILRGADYRASRPLPARRTQEPEARGHPGDWYLAPQKLMHGGRRQRHGAGKHELGDLVESDRLILFTFALHDEGEILLGDAGARLLHIERQSGRSGGRRRARDRGRSEPIDLVWQAYGQERTARAFRRMLERGRQTAARNGEPQSGSRAQA